jgi:hypothetical protein
MLSSPSLEPNFSPLTYTYSHFIGTNIFAVPVTHLFSTVKFCIVIFFEIEYLLATTGTTCTSVVFCSSSFVFESILGWHFMGPKN